MNFKITDQQRNQIANILHEAPTRYGMPVIEILKSLEEISDQKKEEEKGKVDGNKKPAV